ncbi:MAG: MBL fold metallo-hydrolase [Chloroflexi bacterium]|nr:MBL fold metallo-hydrolase [Chloroflexota bacterium]
MVLTGKTGLQEVASGAWAMVTSTIEPEGGGPNAGFILAGDQVVVIDSLISLSGARELHSHIKRVTGREPTYLINTHPHADHIVGNQIFSPPANIIAHESVRQVLLRDGNAIIDRLAQMRPALANDLKAAKVVAPGITFSKRMTLHFDGCTIQLIHPGKAHTIGDTMVYCPEEKLLYSGDLLFNHIIPPIMGDSSGWLAAIEQIEAMDIKAIVPGHGFVCTKQEITDLKHCLIKLRQEVKKCHDQKVSKEKVLAEIDMGIYKQWPHQERLAMDVDQLYKEFGASA